MRPRIRSSSSPPLRRPPKQRSMGQLRGSNFFIRCRGQTHDARNMDSTKVVYFTTLWRLSIATTLKRRARPGRQTRTRLTTTTTSETCTRTRTHPRVAPPHAVGARVLHHKIEDLDGRPLRTVQQPPGEMGRGDGTGRGGRRRTQVESKQREIQQVVIKTVRVSPEESRPSIPRKQVS